MSLDIRKYRIPQDLEKYRKDLIPFAYKELEPLAEKADELDKMDKRLLPLMSKAGLLSLPYPKEYGGYSLPYSQWCRLLEIPAGVGGVVRGFTHMGTAIWRMLYFHGTKEQKERYLRPIVGGKTIGGFAFTEPDTGTGVDIKTTAEKRGGSYVLNGTKHLISNSDIASYYHVVAYTDRSKGAQGISCFLVDAGTPGLTIRRMDPMMSYRGVDHGILEFKNCKVSSSQLLGKEGRGMQIAIDTFLSPSRWSIGVSCLGLAQRLLDLSVDFSKKRVTFGKPIAQRQAVQQMLADMATQVFALRCMIDETSRRMDGGKDCIQENSMCKSYGIQAVRQVSDIALEIHGGIGLTKRFPVERLYREGRAMWFEEGTPTIQRMVIARNLLGSR